MAKKVKSKRKYNPEDSLKKSRNTKVRGEFIDYDYTQQLDEESATFLAKFNNEYYGAAISKTKSGKVRAKHLHKNLAQVKEIYDDNNRRNNDVLGVTRANSLLSDVQSEIEKNDGWYMGPSEANEDFQNWQIDTDEQEYLTREEYEKVKEQLTIEMQLFYEVYFSEELD